jgi:hypothetical protein
MEIHFDNVLGQMEFKNILFQMVKITKQICQTRPLFTVWDISGATGGISIRFILGWKLDISSFPSIYGKTNIANN